MTMPSTIDTVIVDARAAAANTHHAYVDWPAIIAGVVLAAAISLVMLGFGSAIGLSFANFHGGATASPVWIGIAAASWLLWVEISSMMAGGYLAGRMSRRIGDSTEHESDVRDGAHGLLVWAGALLIGAMVATSGIGAAASAIGNVAGTVTNATATAAGSRGRCRLQQIELRSAPPTSPTRCSARRYRDAPDCRWGNRLRLRQPGRRHR